jgi:hypothetical protein
MASRDMLFRVKSTKQFYTYKSMGIFFVQNFQISSPLWLEGDSHELVQFPTKFREKIPY